MEVTYLANSRVYGHKPGQIYKASLTPQLRAILKVGRHLTLIDPPTWEQIDGSPKSAANPEKRRKVARQDNGDRTLPESGQRLGVSETVSPEVGRVEVIYGWEAGGFGGGETSGESEERIHNPEREEGNQDI